MYRENPDQADDRQYSDYHLDRNGSSLEAENQALRIYAVMGSSSDKHDCKESREVIEKLPLLEGDSYMSPPKYYMGDTYHVKCKICGNSWWQNYP